jgi:hypothetical protein
MRINGCCHFIASGESGRKEIKNYLARDNISSALWCGMLRLDCRCEASR